MPNQITTDSAHFNNRIRQPADADELKPQGNIKILRIHNSANTPTVMRTHARHRPVKNLQGKLNSFMHTLWFILKSTTRILQKHYESHNTGNDIVVSDENPGKRTPPLYMDVKEYRMRKKAGVMNKTVIRHRGENLAGIYNNTFTDHPPINENMASLLFSAKKTINSVSFSALPTALAASQSMGHSTQRQSLLKKPVNSEKRFRAERRQKNAGPPGKIERRKSDRRARSL